MPKRTDANQAEIVETLREAGASVQDLHEVGHGCPDLLVFWGGRLYLLEVKTEDGRLTADEKRWHLRWLGKVHIVRTAEEALKVIGVLERC